jgi:hypothetical protein
MECPSLTLGFHSFALGHRPRSMTRGDGVPFAHSRISFIRSRAPTPLDDVRGWSALRSLSVVAILVLFEQGLALRGIEELMYLD